MSKKLYSLDIRGKEHEWSFNVYVDPKDVQDYWDDGLEIFEVVNWVPDWMPGPLIMPWFFIQDIFNLRNPFAND